MVSRGMFVLYCVLLAILIVVLFWAVYIAPALLAIRGGL